MRTAAHAMGIAGAAQARAPESKRPREASTKVVEAKVLVGLGELEEAERIVAERLYEAPDDLTALNLFAKIKHIKGELSQAVACWAQLHARSPHNELALMWLGSLLELARDPERHAGDFVALAQKNLALGPAVIELEGAFRLLLAGKTAEAKAVCDRIAARHRRKDREAYKLSVLAKAWIAELSGELDDSRRVLEALGVERGFETDTDRVLALARVYERLGDRGHLEKAVHVHRFLDRSFEKISAQSRLAALCRKLGRERDAEEHERRFQLAFERRMHRPSRAEIAVVAARRFMPLRRLATVRASSDPSTDAIDSAGPSARRARAIFEFLAGRLEVARELFDAGSELLDRKYLASLRAEAGDPDGAVDIFLEALREDPSDEQVLSFLLADRGVSPTVEAALRGTALGACVRERLEAALQASPRRADTWRATSALLRIDGDEAAARRHAERARAVEAARRRDERPVGRVLAAAAYRFVGKSKGLVHQVWADRKPAAPGRGGFLHAEDILGNVTPEMRQATRNTFFAVREYARSRFPHRTADILDYDYTYKVTKEDEPSGGLSAGLPTALAFLSVFLQLPIPQDVAFTGVLIADSHDVLVLRMVGDAAFKVKAAYHKNVRAIVLPAENRFELAQSPEVPRAACEEIARFASNLDEAISLTFGERVWID